MKQIFDHIYFVVNQAVRTSLVLFKITIPIIILTRILNEWGMIDYLGYTLAPIMGLVGLPGSMGLVWATAMMTNLYAGMIVFASLAPAETLSIAQVTVLCTMMLVAHALPVELRIAQKAGTRFSVMILLRLSGALVLGMILFHAYRATGYLQAPNTAIWQPAAQENGWLDWAIRETINLGYVFLIILTLISIMHILELLKVTALLTTLLKPFLNLLGISREAAPLTIIGMTMGIGYGGGLLIREVQQGHLGSRDLFFSFCLMGLCHSVIEDTLLMMVLGGHLSGILLSRFVFAVIVTIILVRLIARVSPAFFHRFLFYPAKLPQ